MIVGRKRSGKSYGWNGFQRRQYVKYGHWNHKTTTTTKKFSIHDILLIVLQLPEENQHDRRTVQDTLRWASCFLYLQRLHCYLLPKTQLNSS